MRPGFKRNGTATWICIVLCGLGVVMGCNQDTGDSKSDSTPSTSGQGNGALDTPDTAASPGNEPENPTLWLCGNGVVDQGELCDPGAPQKPCPVNVLACNDFNPCTNDILLGTGCQARCSHTPNNSSGLDGCCPAGAPADPDCPPPECTDCGPTCGNGVVNSDELCDVGIVDGPGACPNTCVTIDPCTTATLVGNGCQVECVLSVITTPIHSDNCCPSGANANEDSDCTPVCENGVLEAGELCDGDCPDTCDDGDVCTTDILNNPKTCLAACSFVPIVTVGLADGCCPRTATTAVNSLNDPDCPAVCGNGVLEDQETCDFGPGSPKPCPTTCATNDPCISVTLQNAGTCTAACVVTQNWTSSGSKADGCCPPGATTKSDVDCAAVCGNGVVDSGETCDTQIVSGPGACPTQKGCADLDPCTEESVMFVSPANLCTAQCSFTTLENCCGNGKVEAGAGELCDIAIGSGQSGACPEECPDATACSTTTLTGQGTCAAQCKTTAEKTGLVNEWYYTQLFYELQVQAAHHADFETHGDGKTGVVAAEPVAVDEYLNTFGFTVEYVGGDPSGHIAWWGTEETGFALRVNCNNYAGCFPPGQHGIRITFVKAPVVTLAMKFPANTNATLFDIQGDIIAQKSAGGKGDSFLAYVSDTPIGAVQITDPGGESMKDLWFSTCDD